MDNLFLQANYCSCKVTIWTKLVQLFFRITTATLLQGPFYIVPFSFNLLPFGCLCGQICNILRDMCPWCPKESFLAHQPHRNTLGLKIMALWNRADKIRICNIPVIQNTSTMCMEKLLYLVRKKCCIGSSAFAIVADNKSWPHFGEQLPLHNKPYYNVRKFNISMAMCIIIIIINVLPV